jgi:hypothetical protein
VTAVIPSEVEESRGETKDDFTEFFDSALLRSGLTAKGYYETSNAAR